MLLPLSMTKCTLCWMLLSNELRPIAAVPSSPKTCKLLAEASNGQFFIAAMPYFGMAVLLNGPFCLPETSLMPQKEITYFLIDSKTQKFPHYFKKFNRRRVRFFYNAVIKVVCLCAKTAGKMEFDCLNTNFSFQTGVTQ